MKPFVLAALAAALTLAGCSGGGNADADGDGKVSIGEAAKRAEAEGLKPEPGLYKTTVTMTGLEIPGLPPEMKNHGAGLSTTVEDCLTAEEAGKGFEEVVSQGQNGDCAYESFALDGGKLDAVMVCKAEGRETRTSLTGTATKTGADLTATTQMAFDGAGRGTMSATVKHERIGACPAK
ncbi:DUF3617 domain-containing protein [Erythrobacter sp. WG]|uniref:DUF3617 domain-containing protein n=1 Tax=Erythrobacter sp. WG TaxID=2985510 RepID=UPI0022709D2D|nr:DUF3617 domain-containing protein [Erythrobacter sp. WG]MCX9148482.1 DUF3617 domain-containing protein [Erythrobacter sp. WG]